MSKFDKLINRFLSKPKDFEYGEMKTLLGGFGYSEADLKGSRVKFVSQTGHTIHFHKPHPSPAIPRYVLDLIEEELKKEGLL
ncbi:MAG: type II toxin-antitoxin system HicA family toxin [Candidatus Eremiobacteraeota bacterium]|nr:type II toxin-antitoxin system HicA family toxin [Candidatus Eremiobacteraeota bacterium]